jgi:hypothetical protein
MPAPKSAMRVELPCSPIRSAMLLFQLLRAQSSLEFQGHLPSSNLAECNSATFWQLHL